MIFVVFAFIYRFNWAFYATQHCLLKISFEMFNSNPCLPELASARAQFLKARIISARVVIKLYGATLT